MALQVFADAGKTEPVCGSAVVSRRCALPADATFSVDVLASQPPTKGYTAFRVVVRYAGDLVLEDQPGLAESRAPDCRFGTEVIEPALGGLAEDYILTCKIGPATSHYDGVLANVHFVCGADGGSGRIDLVAGTRHPASLYLYPDIYGSLFFLASVGKWGTLVADSVYVNCDANAGGASAWLDRETAGGRGFVRW